MTVITTLRMILMKLIKDILSCLDIITLRLLKSKMLKIYCKI